MHQSFLTHARNRYLWVALFLLLGSLIAYGLHDPIGPPNGGTWLGYTLGTWQSTHYNEAGKGQVTTGKYVTIWRKQADGSWKVVFDGGNPDSSPQLTTAP